MWHTCSYEVRGRKHELTNLPCQDKTAVFNDKANSVTAIALADGAGSARLSEKGAECIINHVLPYVSENFDKLYENRHKQFIKDELLNYLQEKLMCIAHEYNCSMENLATTMLFCVIKDSRFLAGHIGDGVIGLLRRSNDVAVLSTPENGYFANETVFVSNADAAFHLRIYGGDIGNINGVILMSDGSANSLYEYRRARFSKAVENIFTMARIMPSESFAELLAETFYEVVRKRTSDDCSVALLTLPISDLSELSLERQQEIFGVTGNDRTAKKRIKKYIQVANMAREEKSYAHISRMLHIKMKFIRKYVHHFKESGLI